MGKQNNAVSKYINTKTGWLNYNNSLAPCFKLNEKNEAEICNSKKKKGKQRVSLFISII